MHNLTHHSRALAVRTHVATAAAHGRVTSALRRGAHHVQEDDRGAQAAEYAMLGGVSAAACGALIKVIKDHPEIFQTVLGAVVRMLSRAVRAWF